MYQHILDFPTCHTLSEVCRGRSPVYLQDKNNRPRESSKDARIPVRKLEQQIAAAISVLEPPLQQDGSIGWTYPTRDVLVDEAALRQDEAVRFTINQHHVATVPDETTLPTLQRDATDVDYWYEDFERVDDDDLDTSGNLVPGSPPSPASPGIHPDESVEGNPFDASYPSSSIVTGISVGLPPSASAASHVGDSSVVSMADLGFGIPTPKVGVAEVSYDGSSQVQTRSLQPQRGQGVPAPEVHSQQLPLHRFLLLLLRVTHIMLLVF